MDSTDHIIEERKRKLIAFFQNDSYVQGFSVLGGAAIIGIILSLLGFLKVTPWFFVFLAIASIFSITLTLVKKRNLSFYPLLAWAVWLAVYIRTRNLALLRDVTTGTWTLGPDLDPFLFLRWAKYIVENGSLYAVDVMRYVPLGFDTRGELLLTPYFIAWTYKIGAMFGFFDSVTHAAVIYPVIMFALTVIAFYFLTQKIFSERIGKTYSSIIAVVASFFLVILPSLLPRTIAGIPEKEAGAFLFMFLAFYFFIVAWKAKKTAYSISFAALAGISTGIMALVWGGYTFIYLTIAPAAFIAFILGKLGRKETIVYAMWLISSFAIMYPFSTRYNVSSLINAIDTGFAISVLFMMLVYLAIFETRLKRYVPTKLSSIPPQISSVIVGALILIIGASIVFGVGFIPSKVNSIIDTLVAPAANRLLVTVAENRQPYFNEWAGSFGPYLRGIPLTFWTFFIASVILFYNLAGSFKKKEQLILTGAYLIFLVSLVFSRYSTSSVLNGTNFLSNLVYAGGFIVFLGTVGYYFYLYSKNREDAPWNSISFEYILFFVFFLISVIAARAAVRTIMVLDPSAAILIGYACALSIRGVKNWKDSKDKWILGSVSLLVVAIILFAGYVLYQGMANTTPYYAPDSYTQQWQGAMSWVREMTPENAVFGHWWDYGYWVQSIGERATILDGGNALSYWNHLMGRYTLTGADDYAAAEFLYAHNATHFLIDSTDIGKYAAFSSIGSNISYDRLSNIPAFYKDPRQVQEARNSTFTLYAGGAPLDEDLIYSENGTDVFLPQGRAGLGGILIEKNREGEVISAPQAVFVFNGEQYFVTLRYAYSKGELIDFNEGLDAGVFIYPRASQNANGFSIDPDGALLYLSKRTIHSQVARLYLFNEPNPYFRLVHSENNLLVAAIKQQDPNFGDFVDYNGVNGPIRIWEMTYPNNITYRPEYVSTFYPAELRGSP